MSLSSQRRSSSPSSSVVENKNNRSDRVRFNLEVTKSVAHQIVDLQKRSHSETKTDVIRKALALFHLFLEEREAGTSIVFRRKNGREETLRFVF